MGWGYSEPHQAGAEPHQMRAGPLVRDHALQRLGSSHTHGAQAMLHGIHPGFSMGTPRAGSGPPCTPRFWQGPGLQAPILPSVSDAHTSRDLG